MKATQIIAIAAITALSISCKREIVQPATTTQTTPLKIETVAATRAPIVGKWLPHGSLINVILIDKEATTTTYDVMMPYKLERPDQAIAGTWTPTKPTSLQVKYEVAKVLAHYPVDNKITLSADKLTITPLAADDLDLGELNVSTNYESFKFVFDPTNKPNEETEVFSSKEEIDYLTGVGNDVATAAGNLQSTTIQMKHAKAMVIIKVTKEQGFIGDDELLKFSFTNNEAPGTQPLKKGDFKIEDNSFVAGDLTQYHRTMSKFPSNLYFSTLVYPATIAAGDVTLTLDFAVVEYQLPIPAKQWESGKVYIYNIKLSASGVSLAGPVNVYDWPTVIKHTVDLE